MVLIYVMTAAVINFFLGGIWYYFFKKPWLLSWNLTEKDLRDKDPKPYLIAFIGSLWAAYGIFLILKHIQPKNTEELITIAIGTWLFILVGFAAKHYAFARVKGKAFLIDYGLDLVGILIMTFIINGAF